MNIPSYGELRLRAITPNGRVGKLLLFRFSPGEMCVYSADTDICLAEAKYFPGRDRRYWLVHRHMSAVGAQYVTGKEAAVRALQRLAGEDRSVR